jgi:hypothetical protein
MIIDHESLLLVYGTILLEVPPDHFVQHTPKNQSFQAAMLLGGLIAQAKRNDCRRPLAA